MNATPATIAKAVESNRARRAHRPDTTTLNTNYTVAMFKLMLNRAVETSRMAE
jgi:hypothetical protein